MFNKQSIANDNLFEHHKKRRVYPPREILEGERENPFKEIWRDLRFIVLEQFNAQKMSFRNKMQFVSVFVV